MPSLRVFIFQKEIIITLNSDVVTSYYKQSNLIIYSIMLKKLRVIAASVFLLLLTLLFLDFTGVLHKWFSWMAKIQLIPAILAVNVIVIISLAVLTVIFGRIYCSVICPFGIFQDGISHIATKVKSKKKKRFNYSPAISWLRYSMLCIFIIAIIAGISIIVSLLDPYAAYGRMASNFFSPLYRLVNNILASFAESVDSYAFYSTEVWIKGWTTFGIATLTFIVVTMLAWRNGRTYCNTICPVGTVLGFLSKFSVFRIAIDTNKCINCKACEFGCKASCIDLKTKNIDNSRCVTCFNCIDKCKTEAIKYTVRTANKKTVNTVSENIEKDNDISQSTDNMQLVVAGNERNNHNGISRRYALSVAGALAVGGIKAQQLQADGGLAIIEDKKIPVRETPLVPPGALGLSNMQKRCTACQLCVSACPNNVLRPSTKLQTFMQPEMSFERGYCRPECIECSQVCPSGAITPVTTAEKTSIAIGYAVWIKDRCIVNTDNVPCNSCERHCPTTAITFVELEPGERNSLKIPVINKELCIGCGACESLCPSRPLSAIYIEGNVRHHLV